MDGRQGSIPEARRPHKGGIKVGRRGLMLSAVCAGRKSRHGCGQGSPMPYLAPSGSGPVPPGQNDHDMRKRHFDHHQDQKGSSRRTISRKGEEPTYPACEKEQGQGKDPGPASWDVCRDPDTGCAIGHPERCVEPKLTVRCRGEDLAARERAVRRQSEDMLGSSSGHSAAQHKDGRADDYGGGSKGEEQDSQNPRRHACTR